LSFVLAKFLFHFFSFLSHTPSSYTPSPTCRRPILVPILRAKAAVGPSLLLPSFYRVSLVFVPGSFFSPPKSPISPLSRLPPRPVCLQRCLNARHSVHCLSVLRPPCDPRFLSFIPGASPIARIPWGLPQCGRSISPFWLRIPHLPPVLPRFSSECLLFFPLRPFQIDIKSFFLPLEPRPSIFARKASLPPVFFPFGPFFTFLLWYQYGSSQYVRLLRHCLNPFLTPFHSPLHSPPFPPILCCLHL